MLTFYKKTYTIDFIGQGARHLRAKTIAIFAVLQGEHLSPVSMPPRATIVWPPLPHVFGSDSINTDSTFPHKDGGTTTPTAYTRHHQLTSLSHDETSREPGHQQNISTGCMSHHYNDITWVWWHLKSPATWLFAQQFKKIAGPLCGESIGFPLQ